MEGNKGMFVKGQSRRACSVATLSFRSSVLSRFQDYFRPKKAFLGHEMRSFGRKPPNLAPSPWGATGEFMTQIWD